MNQVEYGIDLAILETARVRFGFERLRPGQGEVVQEVVRGRDALAVFPTGSGKSAIYQIAGLSLPGATVVVSPLIALQRDQVDSIARWDAGAADAINAHRSERQREATFARLADGSLEYVFLAPEQLSNPDTLERIAGIRPSLFVVDEAHCISEWGHDFRPDYARLGDVIAALGHPITLALTATAAPPVRDEIVQRLGMRDPLIAVQGFDRPNIELTVHRVDDDEAKRAELRRLVSASALPGIVYVATRQDADNLASGLRDNGIIASAYHAGLSAQERDDVQRAFMCDELDVIVATIAFGMGIDKPNVRFVIHYAVSESIDAYYQEIGRAGRDGAAATATLLYLPEDLNLRWFQAATGTLSDEDVLRVLTSIRRAKRPKDADAIVSTTRLSSATVTRALSRLEDVGAIECRTDGAVLPVAGVKPKLASIAAANLHERHRRISRTRLEMMRQFAQTSGCRRAFLLGYFGEAFDPPCGSCDNCRAGLSRQSLPGSIPFPVTSLVEHSSWGRGEVVHYEHDTVTVLFDDAGYRTLATELVIQGQLLRQMQV